MKLIFSSKVLQITPFLPEKEDTKLDLMHPGDYSSKSSMKLTCPWIIFNQCMSYYKGDKPMWLSWSWLHSVCDKTRFGRCTMQAFYKGGEDHSSRAVVASNIWGCFYYLVSRLACNAIALDCCMVQLIFCEGHTKINPSYSSIVVSSLRGMARDLIIGCDSRLYCERYISCHLSVHQLSQGAVESSWYSHINNSKVECCVYWYENQFDFMSRRR